LDNQTVVALQFIAENIEELQELLNNGNNDTDPTPVPDPDPVPEPPSNATLVENPSLFVQSNWAESFNTLYDINVAHQQYSESYTN
jgi:hypothetical protein